MQEWRAGALLRYPGTGTVQLLVLATIIPFLGARIYGLDRIFVYYCYAYIYFKNIQKAFVIVVHIFILKLF